ncbi:hypothetical protein H0H93_014297 [Arthromyces matolae]|nr:hypothetical protein H0H93_014297 [Arthromyces matolae]
MSDIGKIIKISEEGLPKGPVPVNFGIVVFPGFQALDAFGPLDVLNVLSTLFPMNLSIIAETLDPVSTKLPIPHPRRVQSNFGQSILPTHTFATCPPLDVLLVPGGAGGFLPSIQIVVDFVAKVYPSLQYLITICNGADIASSAGVLDGKRATRSKVLWNALTERKTVEWVPRARWVVDGNVWTSSGVSSGLDAIFAFVGAVYGEEVAEQLSDVLEYERHKDPSWDPFADILGIGRKEED